jgi:thiol-disulfide isomerase/thioredoxin
MKKSIWMLAVLMATTLLLSACTLAPSAPADTTEAPAMTEATEATEATAAPAADATIPMEPDSALSFSVDTLTGGTLDPSVFSEHKLVMVNYWATWCGPCVGEIPDLVKISKDYADKGFAIVGVLTGDDDIEGAKKFIADQGMEYPVVLPEAFFGDNAAGISAIPTTMFFDANGKQVGDTIVGAMSYDDWASTIDEMLAKVS